MRKVIAAGIVLTALATAPTAAQQTVVGNAATVVGDVKLSNVSIRTPRKVERRQRLAWGDLIDTAKRSQLQILLLDKSTFGIGANSQVRIDRFVYDPSRGRSVIATFFKGALRFFTGDEGENSAEVTTPAGRIGIRGTALDVLVGESAKDIAEDEDFVDDADGPDGRKNEATLVVLRGPGAATAGGLTVGRAEVEGAGVTVVLDQPGLAAYIPRNGAPPIGPFFISNKGLANVQDELAPEVARAADGGNGAAEAAAATAIIGGAACLLLFCRHGDDNNNRTNQTPTSPTANNPNNTANTPPSRPPPPPPPVRIN